MSNNRRMGLWSGVPIDIGGMVGAGIFSIPGIAFQTVGNAIYISFIIAEEDLQFNTQIFMEIPKAGKHFAIPACFQWNIFHYKRSRTLLIFQCPFKISFSPSIAIFYYSHPSIMEEIRRII